jgi:hypothetical protein
VKSRTANQLFAKGISLLFVFVTVSACSVTSGTSTDSESNRPTSSETVQKSNSDCIIATRELLVNISSLAQDGTGLRPVSGYYVKSDDFKSVYFVAMEFSATGIENQIGVWVSNKRDGSNLIMSVDGTAKQFTDWFHSDESDAQISILDPNFDKVKGCFN